MGKTLLKEFQLYLHAVDNGNNLTVDDHQTNQHFLLSFVPKSAWSKDAPPKPSSCCKLMPNTSMKNTKSNKYNIPSVAEFFSKKENEAIIQEYWEESGIMTLLGDLHKTRYGELFQNIKKNYYNNKKSKTFGRTIVTILQNENNSRNLFDYFAAGFIERCLSRLGNVEISVTENRFLESKDTTTDATIDTTTDATIDATLEFFNAITVQLDSDITDQDLFSITLDLFRYALCNGLPEFPEDREDKKIQILKEKLAKNNVTIDDLNEYIDIILKTGSLSTIGNQQIFSFVSRQDQQNKKTRNQKKLNPLITFEFADSYYYNVNGINGKGPDYNKAFEQYKEIWEERKYPPAGWSLGYIWDRYDEIDIGSVSKIAEIEDKSLKERRKMAIDLFYETAKMGCSQSFTSLGNLCKEDIPEIVSNWDNLSELLSDSDESKGIPFNARFLPCRELYEILDCPGISKVSVPSSFLKTKNLKDDPDSLFELFQSKCETINLRIDFANHNRDRKIDRKTQNLMYSLIQNSAFEYVSRENNDLYILLAGFQLYDMYGQNICKKRQEELYRIAAEKGDLNGKNNFVGGLRSKLLYENRRGKKILNNTVRGILPEIETAIKKQNDTRKKVKESVVKHLKNLADSHYPNGENILGTIFVGNDSLSNELVFDKLDENDDNDKSRIREIKKEGKNLLKRAAERKGTLSHTWAKINYSKALHDLETENREKFRYIREAIQISFKAAHNEGIYKCYIAALNLANEMGMYEEDPDPEIYQKAFEIATKIYNKINSNQASINDFTTELQLIRILLEAGHQNQMSTIINHFMSLPVKENNLIIKLRFYDILLGHYLNQNKEVQPICNSPIFQDTCRLAREKQIDINNEAPNLNLYLMLQ